LLFSGLLVSQDQTPDDILFLKIQELEEEIAFLRSELESQAYLLEKLQNEDPDNKEQSSSNDNDSQVFRFEGINDDETIDELYQNGINSLNLNELDAAEEAFLKLVENYSDEEKLPLSLFWLGEISLISLKYVNSKDYFLSLVSQFPDHWRSPLAHKKIGDVYLSQGLNDEAKEKYQYVANSYPENTAASLALQILENME
jgi:TolA-binding protein